MGSSRERISWRDLLREALLPLRDRPSRSMLTSAGVAVGAAAFVVTTGLQATNGAQIRTSLSELRSTQVLAQISVPASETLAGDGLKHMEHGVGSAGAVEGGLTWKIGDQVTVQPMKANRPSGPPLDLPLIAATPSILQAAEAVIEPAGLTTVAALMQSPVVIVGKGLADQLEVETGDAIKIGSYVWPVVAFVADSRLQPDLILSLIVPADAALSRFPQPELIDALLRSAPGETTALALRAPGALVPQQPRRVVALPVPDASAVTQPISDQVLRAGLGVSLAAVIIGMLMTGTAAYVSVLERQGELALRRSLGARPRDVGRQVALESAATACIGALCGLLVGVLVVLASATMRGLPAVLPLQVVLLTVPAGVAAGVLAGLLPARRANRVDPVVYLRRL